MPTFDGGHYFLTVLVPIRTDVMKDDRGVTSPVHALRKQLSMLPTAAETPACGGGQSPFARNKRNHFARLFVIDDVAYNGRTGQSVVLTEIRKTKLTVAQPQDHLTCPFLLFAADFEAGAERHQLIRGSDGTAGLHGFQRPVRRSGRSLRRDVHHPDSRSETGVVAEFVGE